MAAPPNYKEIAAIARKRRDGAIPSRYLLPPEALKDLPRNLTGVPRESGHFSEKEIEIMDAEATDILRNIRERTWSAFEVTDTFCKAAIVAHQLTNCLTEVMFPEAITRAKFLDEYQATHGTVIGPLHGLPFSLKDHFITPPYPTSIGIALLANLSRDPSTETMFVTIMRDLGAIPYVKTNVPTAMMMMETKNNIWGEARNPLQKEMSPGGSSGGECALVAMRGSPLGFGTEIGGSLRHPAAWNHLYALKPSCGRFPLWGLQDRPVSILLLAIIGPVARSLSTIQLFSETLLSEKVAPWTLDPTCVPIPWRRNVIQPKGRKLRFGIIGNSDGVVTCHPPVERALDIVRECLENAGHEVFDWEPIEHPQLWQNLLASLVDIGLGTLSGILGMTDEPIFPSMAPFLDERVTAVEDGVGPEKLQMLGHQRARLQKEYLERWQATAKNGKAVMDGIIMAASPWAACRLGTVDKAEYFGYAGVFNPLDLPACTFPVTFADKTVDKKRVDFQPLNDLDARIQNTYDPGLSDGGPASLQLIGRRLEEEKVLEMVEIVTDILKKNNILPV